MSCFALPTTYPPEQQTALKTAFWPIVSKMERANGQGKLVSCSHARVLSYALYLSLYLYIYYYIIFYYIFIYILYIIIFFIMFLYKYLMFLLFY